MRLLSALVASLLVVAVLGEGYYVSPFGSDFNSGTSPSKPFKTIRKAASVVDNGDHIHLEDGTYGGFNNWAEFDKPVTIEANNEGLAIILGGGSSSTIGCMNLSLGGGEPDDDSDGSGSAGNEGDGDFSLQGIQFTQCPTAVTIRVTEPDTTYTVGIDSCSFAQTNVAIDINPEMHTLHELTITDTKFFKTKDSDISIKAEPSSFYVKDLTLENTEAGTIFLQTFSGDLTIDSSNLAFGSFVGTSHGNGKISLKDSYFTNYSLEIYDTAAQSSDDDNIYIHKSEVLNSELLLSGPFHFEESNFISSHVTFENGYGNIESTDFKESLGAPAITLQQGSNVEVDSCVISFNENKDGNGAGIAVFDGSNLHVKNSQLDQNVAGTGGAIYLQGSFAQIESSDFSSNGASAQGGAIYCESSSIELDTNDFENNLSPVGAAVDCVQCSIEPGSKDNTKNNNIVDDGGCAPY